MGQTHTPIIACKQSSNQSARPQTTMEAVTQALAPLALMYNKYAAVANEHGDAFLAYTIGDRPGYGDAMKNYPMARFSEAFTVATGYLLFATVGAGIYSKIGPKLD